MSRRRRISGRSADPAVLEEQLQEGLEDTFPTSDLGLGDIDLGYPDLERPQTEGPGTEKKRTA